MSRLEPAVVDFSESIGSLAASQVWEYDCGAKQAARDVAGQTHRALLAPIDFPSIESAIVAGDRVALAVDPNVPQLGEVITGIIKTIGETEAGEIDIVLWGEALDATIEDLKDTLGDSANVLRHETSQRESLRYLGADYEAAPIYLSRALVDADFVLPVVCGRPADVVCAHDLTGVYPSLADAATRMRHRTRLQAADLPALEKLPPGQLAPEQETAWLLGVHLVVCVTATSDGEVGDVVAGPPDAIRKHITPPPQDADQFPPVAPLVIASLDGNAQHQTWENAARALIAATRYAAPGAAIVVWTELNLPPPGVLAGLADLDQDDLQPSDEEAGVSRSEEDEFPTWDESLSLARSVSRVAAEYRVFIRSQLDREAIEPIGLGAISDLSELVQLSQSFEACGVLRGAQFAGSTIDAPHRISVES